MDSAAIRRMAELEAQLAAFKAGRKHAETDLGYAKEHHNYRQKIPSLSPAR